MSSIGPDLPAHLSKRKRTPEDDGNGPSSPPHKQSRAEAANRDEINLDDSEDDEDDYGPKAPTVAKPTAGPSLPPSNQDEIDLGSDAESETGPAAPPTASHPQDDSSDSDDDYGPALPGAANARKAPIGPALPPSEATPQRDSWMLAPPTASSYSERDPTRIRSRKFASKPASSGPSSGVSSIWTETPEEKLRRLQDSVLGRADPAGEAPAGSRRKTKEEEERERKIAANIQANRGKSLYEEHQTRRKEDGDEEEEDDPSKRGFDREKDMALGGKIGTSQRKEFVTKAADFGSRFQKGSYL